MARLEVSLLGTFEVRLNKKKIATFKSSRVRAILAFLVAEHTSAHKRESIAALIWPDWFPKSAMSNLRYALSDLRKNIEDGVVKIPSLIISREEIQINLSSDLWIDVVHFTNIVKKSDSQLSELDSALKLFRGPFLDGFIIKGSASFESWLLTQREYYDRLKLKLLSRLIAGYEQIREYETALGYAYCQVSIEPLLEEAHQQIMRLLVLNGQRGAALLHYETCCQILKDELGIEPGVDTQKIYQAIRNDQVDDIGVGMSDVRIHQPIIHDRKLPGFMVVETEKRGLKTRFVSREKELGELNRALRSALGGNGQVRFVIGSPGQGKTTLVMEFIRQSLESYHNLLIVMGNSQAYFGLGDPYLPFREILEMLVGDVEDHWQSGSIIGIHARRLWEHRHVTIQEILTEGPALIETFVSGERLLLQAGYQDSRPEWFGDLDRLVSLRKQATRQSLQKHTASQDAVISQYTKTLQAISRHVPLVLFIDDLQWIDPGSLNIMLNLAKRIKNLPILILGAYRPLDVPSGGDINAQRLLEFVDECQLLFDDLVIDLDLSEDREWLDAYIDLHPNQLGIAFRDRLYDLTHSQPLYTIELIRAMKQRGELVENAQGELVSTSKLDWNYLPVKVESAIGDRIHRLSDQQRQILQVASVEGETFTAEVISDVLNRELTEILNCLTEELGQQHKLVRGESIHRKGKVSISRYRFQHILFQVYLYNGLELILHTHLHEKIADSLFNLHHNQLEEIAVKLAYHYEKAMLFEKAIHYLDIAGERAARLYSNVEAIQNFSHALDLLGENDLDLQFSLLKKREMIYSLVGLRSEQKLDVETMFSISKLLGLDEQAYVAMRFADYFGCTWDWESLDDAVHNAIRAAQKAGNSHNEALAYNSLGVFFQSQGQVEEAEAAYLQALAVALKAGDLHLQAEILRWIADFFVAGVGDTQKSLEFTEQSRLLFKQLGDPVGLAVIPMLEGLNLEKMHDYSGAVVKFEQSRQLCRQIGNHFDETWALAHLSRLMNYLGCLKSIKDYLLEAVETVEELKNESLDYLLRAYISMMYWNEGDSERALHYANLSYEFARQGAQFGKIAPAIPGILFFYIGFLLTDLNQVDEAQYQYRRSIEILLGVDNSIYTVLPLSGLAYIALKKRKFDEAFQLTKEFLPDLENFNEYFLEPRKTWCYLVAYQVLSQVQNPYALNVIEKAYLKLASESANIRNPEHRYAFVNTFHWNRKILALWSEYKMQKEPDLQT